MNQKKEVKTESKLQEMDILICRYLRNLFIFKTVKCNFF